MILSLAVLFVVLWVLGVAFSFTAGGLIHGLLVLALAATVYHFIAEYDDQRHHVSIFEQ